MKFYKLHDSISKECLPNVKLKAEYFWHYWDFLFTDNRDLILVNEPKFSSQISLISKVEKHLEWNSGINCKKLLKYFNHHSYFHKQNILLRSNDKLSNEIQSIKKRIENKEEGVDDSKYLSFSERERLRNAFKNLRNDFFDLNIFPGILIGKLLNTIFSKKNLDKNCKQDLKFLSNSIIDLFVLKGYSLAFIKGLLSNTIFNPSNKFNFRYEKNSADFDSYELWKEYVSEQFKLLSLKDRINYLEFFLKEPQHKGFYIFKIEGVDFQSEPIEIFESTFYNPKKNKILNFYKTDKSKIREEDFNYYSNCELFNENYYEINDSTKENSTCNLIIPTKYNTEDIDHFDSFKFPTKSFIEAYSRAEISLLEFKRCLKSFSIEHFYDEKLTNVRLSKHSILVDEKYNYHKISNNKESSKITFRLDDIRKSMLDELLIFKNNIKSQNSFSIHLANSNALIASNKLEYHKLNFKSLWIECVEPYFDNTDEFIDFAKKCIRIRTNFFTNYRILLSNALSENFSFYRVYSLDQSKMDEIGLGKVNIGESIIGDVLEKKIELLPCGSMLCEFKDEMRSYVKDKSSFFIEIDKWISNTIRVAYDERNIEVHYNIVDYYNDVSIKKDILFIISCIIGTFNDAIFKYNVSSSKGAKKYVDNTLHDLKKGC
ncbi:hypothetical protein ACFSKN_00965 [Mariniflexile gromovii]|uniref:Lantibiotic biosynthesis dehydratase-like protein n=1 Tax=Mariniflexile gromovii TaxID=362523 RepID=A0ABS4BSR2_9FLAO|nr:hypothetical protein [Mariniflexile gromovii]MBP0903448.1 hypothetical protein [Mariniflexile gromovii]